MPRNLEDLQQILIERRGDWRSWLQQNHQQQASVWVVTWKKRSSWPHVPYEELRDEALCFGWIDSLPRKLDLRRSMLLMSPRRPRSAWSAVNKGRIEELMGSGLMTEAGLAAIDRAKRDGSWSLLDGVDPTVPPEDLVAALERTGSVVMFEAFPPSSRRAIIEWISLAKRVDTRRKRVAETARLAAMGLRGNHPEAKGR